MQEVRSSILLVSTIQKSEVSRNLNDSAGLFCIYRLSIYKKKAKQMNLSVHLLGLLSALNG